MKKIKLFLASVAALVLVGCGGHGYEGEYVGKMEKSMLGKSDKTVTMVIGSNYMELAGERSEYDTIQVVDNNLVLQKGEKKESLAIVDDSTLSMDAGYMVVKFTKI
ncbi:hypothetical protein OTK49_21020 [Vibrio coralliirubri]|uniref:hypothetical protein n=1 Tax=Vibrio coralliirubri TaxID=1516159 RepID=UPI002284A7B8|nr:hypothetical protein [Vibrio coralliirubri]MCY9865002.1 hypothetical protein [Vibrio coralliirubri]